MPLRCLTRALAVALGLVLAVPAGAIGFGAVPGSVGYGRPLDVAVPLRLEAGEAVPPGCLRADVVAGERRLPPEAVEVRLEPSADGGLVRVRSVVALLEPVIDVALTVGCAPSVSRRFTFLADPPAAVPPLAGEAARPAAAGPMSRPMSGPMSGPPAAVATVAASRVAVAAVPAVRGETAAALPSAHAPAARAAVALAPGRAAAGGPAGADDPSGSGALGAGPAADESRIALNAAALAATPVAAALHEAAQGAGAVPAASAQAQSAAMQARLLALHTAAAADRRTIGELRERLARAEARLPWQPLWWGLVAVLGLTTAGLGWRLRGLHRTHAAGTGQPRAGPGVAAPSAVDPAADALPAGGGADAAGTPPAAPAGAGSLLERSEPLGAATADPVDQLIDLDQQADFFVVLGDDDSAIDLLLAHLRRCGGTSPLPHLKLLEIYRRRGDHEAFERTCGRFARRFNARPVVEDGAADGSGGLLGQPAVLDALQRAWPVPSDAMARLEALLFPQVGDAVFDLATYGDALMLYGVARDVLRRDGAGAGQVDLLLPLAAGADPGAEAPYITAAQPSRPLPLGGWAAAPGSGRGRRCRRASRRAGDAGAPGLIDRFARSRCERAARARRPHRQRRASRSSAPRRVSSRLAKHSRAMRCSKPSA